jgi:hypothetical protein
MAKEFSEPEGLICSLFGKTELLMIMGTRRQILGYLFDEDKLGFMDRRSDLAGLSNSSRMFTGASRIIWK